MKAVMIFAGTSEGRSLAEFCGRSGIKACVSVATEYGETLLPKGENIEVITGYKNREQMEEWLSGHSYACVVDATHPYASKATEHIKEACAASGTVYYRLLRESSQRAALPENAVCVGSVREAAEYLSKTQGKILVTTGSKEIRPYTQLLEAERMYFRVLATPESLDSCQKKGISPKQIIAMQGPFGRELNAALLAQFGCRYLVTKESGAAGGFEEKLLACADTGAIPVVITRPEDEPGRSLEEIKRELLTYFPVQDKQKVIIAGIGPGEKSGMTWEALERLEEADACIGSGRMLKEAKMRNKPVFDSYRPEEIESWIEAHPEYRNILVMMSGDTGFYSGTKRLKERLTGCEVTLLPGVSSMSAFCAKLGISWDDMVFCSMHGRYANLTAKIMRHPKVFTLLGKEEEFKQLLRQMIDFGMDDVTVCVGADLSYEQEEIFTGTPEQALQRHFSELCCAVFLNKGWQKETLKLGLPEEAFIRDRVPMTKEEIRCISIAKLKPSKDSVIYDIGAGTGSVSVELSLYAEDGMVYAVEKKPQAAALIEENRKHFCLSNLKVVEGMAPQALEGLPAPTHAFIGGSSGNLREIVAWLKGANPAVRIVVNAIALETVAEIAKLGEEYPMEIVQVQVARSKAVGNYHMMMGQNPVTIALIV